MSIDVGGIEDGQREMWTIGDDPDIARTLTGVVQKIVEHAGPGPGVSLLDVATGMPA